MCILSFLLAVGGKTSVRNIIVRLTPGIVALAGGGRSLAMINVDFPRVLLLLAVFCAACVAWWLSGSVTYQQELCKQYVHPRLRYRWASATFHCDTSLLPESILAVFAEQFMWSRLAGSTTRQLHAGSRMLASSAQLLLLPCPFVAVGRCCAQSRQRVLWQVGSAAQ